MKNLSDIISDLNYHKPNYKLQSNDAFNAYMINRWLSMISPSYCNLINETYNRLYNAFDNNQQRYDFLKTILPKKFVKFPKYIKKTEKVKESKNSDLIDQIAKTHEISKREVEEIIKNMDVKELKKEYLDDSLKVYQKKEK